MSCTKFYILNACLFREKNHDTKWGVKMCCMHVFDGLWQRSHFSSLLSLNTFMIVRSMINYLLRVYFCHYFFACECIVVVRTVQHEEPLDWQISIRKHNGSKVQSKVPYRRIGNRNCSTGTEVFNEELNYETFRVRPTSSSVGHEEESNREITNFELIRDSLFCYWSTVHGTRILHNTTCSFRLDFGHGPLFRV